MRTFGIAATTLAGLAAGGCRDRTAPTAPAASSARPVSTPTLALPSGWTCKQPPFAESAPVPEASGAAWIDHAGRRALFVISDSGNAGAYNIVAADTGETLARGQLAIGPHGDDFEGATRDGDDLVLALSAGYTVRVRPKHDAWAAEDAVPIGDVIAADDEPKGHGTRPPRGEAMVCDDSRTGNCGRNIEGICLAPTPVPPPASIAAADACVGFVAAKADGHLYCLTRRDGGFHAEFARSIEVASPGMLADCAFADDGSLWTGNNLPGMSVVSRVANWQVPSAAVVEPIGPLGVGNAEVLAVTRAGEAYDIIRMSDTNTAPSAMVKFRCTPP